MTPYLKFALTVPLVLAIAGCGGAETKTAAAAEEAEAPADEYERGPHNGRMLRDGDFAIEVTIFEDGVPPEYHLYPYLKGKPIRPGAVEANVTLRRLDGEINRFAFQAEQDFLAGQGVVTEPHSFDVEVTAQYGAKRYSWRYPSYEGRNTITSLAARQAGVKVEPAGPAAFEETIELTGTITFAPTAQSEVGARFPGIVMSVGRNVGDRVSAGTLLARVESSESLQTYSVVSPRSGIVLERRTNVGDVTGSEPIFIVGDPAEVVATFPVYPRDMERVRPGQSIAIQTIAGERIRRAVIANFLPTAQSETQTLTARVPLANPDGFWRDGMGVKGVVTVARSEVPLAVKVSALQAYRDFTVVYAKVGDTYEVRMLELGRQTPEWAEVKGGIKPGQPYVTDGSYIIKADIDKSGASHDH